MSTECSLRPALYIHVLVEITGNEIVMKEYILEKIDGSYLM